MTTTGTLTRPSLTALLAFHVRAPHTALRASRLQARPSARVRLAWWARATKAAA